MQEQEIEKLRAVSWSEVMPWLVLARCFRLAISTRLLILSAVATLLTVGGWTVFTLAFSGDPQVARQAGDYDVCPWRAVTDLVPDSPPLLRSASSPAGRAPDRDVGAESAAPSGPGSATRLVFRQPSSILSRTPEPMLGTWRHLGRPFAEMFRAGTTVEGLAFLALCGLWSLLVWSFFGACIARVAAVRLAAGERIGWGAMLRHAGSKWRAYVAAPLFPLVAVLVLGAPIGLAGWLLLWLDWTVLIAGLLWPLFLIAGLLMAVLLLGLAFGWPLMWGTIASEGTDSFDALSRSYNYTFQRPLHYLFYAAVASVLGGLGWILVVHFAGAVIGLTYGAVAWGAGAARMEAVFAPGPSLSLLGFGVLLVRVSVGCVKLLAVAYLSSYFWTASTAIYFLLRRSVDATEMDEVYLDEEGQQTYGLPPIKTDGAGAPVVDDSGAASEAE